MIGGTDVLFNVQVLAQFPHRGSCKSGVVVGDDLLGEAVMGENVFAVKFGDSYGVNRFFAWDKYGPF